ncbi:MAG: ribosome assembly factor SBDS [Candidatus Aenigmatarchaeota archaeon]
MTDIEKSVVCRLKRGDKVFEILVDPEKAAKFKKGEISQIEEVLSYPEIYKDVRKGDLVSREDLEKIFRTSNINAVARRILQEGEIQLTTEQRRKALEEKKKEIATIISRRGINPQTNTPHPPQRILNAMEQVGVHIDPFLDANVQVEKIVKDLKVILPIKFESVKVQVRIPPQHAGRAYSEIKRLFTDSDERWLNDGSLELNINIPAGLEAELMEKIGFLTKGNFTSKVIERSG